MARSITLHTPRDPATLAAALAPLLGPIRIGSAAGHYGHCAVGDVKIVYYDPYREDNIRTTLTATIAADRGGSRITGTIGLPSIGGLLMVCWYAVLILMGLSAIPFLVLVGPALLVFGGAKALAIAVGGTIALLLFMALLGRFFTGISHETTTEDQTAILAFLTRTVDAREVGPIIAQGALPPAR